DSERVRDTAPRRALTTGPRGADGREPEPLEPIRAGASRPVTPSPTIRRQDIPESRRRLQSTLLTCSMFKRPAPALDVRPEVVMFTEDSAGDPKAVLRSRKNLEAQAEILARAPGIGKDTRVLTAVPLFHP